MLKAKNESHQAFVDSIRRVLEQTDGSSARTYSGRGMYGRVCIGIDVDSFDPFRFGTMLAHDLVESGMDPYDAQSLFDEVGDVRWDSMGTGMIWYWPAVIVEKIGHEVNDEDEE